MDLETSNVRNEQHFDSVNTCQQQQQQQHTLLTFPKGAFQRQCYKNNPITIKKSYLQLKMF